MYVIQHKGMSITDTASASEIGAWNQLFKMHPSLAKKSRRELETLEYKARKTIPHSKKKREQND